MSDDEFNVSDADEAGPPREQPHMLTVDVLRHSAAHLMAAAVVDLFPGAQYDVGPAIRDGFFYNFRMPAGGTISADDLIAIEKRMRELAAQGIPYERQVIPRAAARELFLELNQPFKVDIIDRLPAETTEVGIYRTGEFVDLCRGPHVKDSSEIRAFSLQRVAGVYWRGDEHNEQLQRIYGTAWLTEEELRQHLELIAEAEKRDHRRLGRELDLYSVNDALGGGLVLWHPNGGVVRMVIEDYWRDCHRRGGYDVVFSPHIAQRGLWETSRHVEFYAESMYGPLMVDDKPFLLKPMNCPFHILMYKSRTRSYRELPLRLAELGTVYRYERSGVLHGLLRVRGFTQDDAHLFCREDQINDEIGRVIDFSIDMLAAFGFTQMNTYLSTKPEKAGGDDEEWHAAEGTLERELRKRELPFEVNPGDGAFYGPKIDLKLVDALGREWQCSTIQFDFTQPRYFALEYVGEDGIAHRPMMVHRALLGSMERFMGMLVEHYAGHFPLWLAPVQCEVIPVQDDVNEVVAYAQGLVTRVREAGLRVTLNDRPGERMQAKVRDAEIRKVPYIIVVGRRDVERGDDVVTVRNTRANSQSNVAVADLLEALREEVTSRRPS